MQLKKNHHLSYCTNIHPGESWKETFANLTKYVPKIKEELNVKTFGLGLRLSNQASLQLLDNNRLTQFQEWLATSGTYLFTLNGFPYGGFHYREIKEKVHLPDWLTNERVDYTKRLFELLATLAPQGESGGISTSPISYRHWHKDPEPVLSDSVEKMMEVVYHLDAIHRHTGRSMHLDIEPEPDGMLETSEEFIRYYNDYLLVRGSRWLKQKGISDPEKCIREHIQLCYDVCHFAVEYETPEDVINAVEKQGIRIGKMQISAALKAFPGRKPEECATLLKKFVEPTYLHQAVIRNGKKLNRYPDLDQSLSHLRESDEIRTHFHVPIFVEQYGKLESTQEDIRQALDLWKERQFTSHLEVETYTWTILPDNLKLPVEKSIARELSWVRNQLL